MSEVTEIQPNSDKSVIEVKSTSPMEVMMAAMDKGLDLEKVEKAMELQFRWDAEQSRKAYLKALSDFQDEMPTIQKTKAVSYKNKDTGQLEQAFKFAPYEEITEQVRPLLKAHGLSFRHSMVPGEQGQQVISCIISHKEGHESVEATMTHGMDSSGGKNDIQAKGSTLKYLKRLTLEAALGLATGPEDSDGESANTPPDTITNEQAAEITDRLESTQSDTALFLKMFKADCVEMLLAKDYGRAISALNKKAKAQASE